MKAPHAYHRAKACALPAGDATALKRLLATLLVGALLGLGAVSVALAQSQKLDRPDSSWISLSGTIAAVGGDSFTLDFGTGEVLVEMDDWDWYNEAHGLAAGDRVTVYGLIDDDMFERRTIEASAVYVDKWQTYYYASAADEESGYYTYPLSVLADEGDWVTVTGTVQSIDGREMTIDTGRFDVDVDTDRLTYNPFAPERLETVEVGSRVSVYGRVDDADFFEGREIEAVSVVTLAQN